MSAYLCRIGDNMKKKIKVGLFVFIVIVVVILNITYKNKNEVTKTKRKKQNNLAIIIKDANGVETNSNDIPIGNYKINEEKTHCENNGKILSYDNTTGKISFSFIGSDRCYLYFDYDSSIDFFGIKIPLDTELDSSGTSGTKYILSNENGLRYEGADPNNYICLDNKTGGTCSDSSLLFRIIGLFEEDTSSDGTSSSGSKKLLKIIDTNNYGGTSGKYWNSAGANNWSTASLKTELNGTYLTTLLGTSNVNSKLSSAIANAKWHLGGASKSNYETITAEGIYAEERNTSAIYSGYTGNPSSIYAKVGLMYPSDYGYATVGGSTKNKSNCRNRALSGWGNTSYKDCKNNDWLFKSQSSFVNDAEWLLSPYASRSYNAAYFFSSGTVGLDGSVDNQFAVRPSIYLDSSILKIVGTGDGSSTNPYRIG